MKTVNSWIGLAEHKIGTSLCLYQMYDIVVLLFYVWGGRGRGGSCILLQTIGQKLFVVLVLLFFGPLQRTMYFYNKFYIF